MRGYSARVGISDDARAHFPALAGLREVAASGGFARLVRFHSDVLSLTFFSAKDPPVVI